MNDNEVLAGQCQCGTIRYRLKQPLVVVYCCHCTNCQQQSSSAFGISAWTREEDFELIRGKPAVFNVRADSGNVKECAYCPDCGCRIYHKSQGDEGILSLKAGLLDHARKLRPAAHIWTRSAQNWVPLDEPGMLVYETEPDDFGEIVAHYEQMI